MNNKLNINNLLLKKRKKKLSITNPYKQDYFNYHPFFFKKFS